MKRLLLGRLLIRLDSGRTFQRPKQLGAGIAMVSRILITSILLWVDVMSLNFPYCWDPICQMWKINQKPDDLRGVVYIVPPESSQQSLANSPSFQCPDITSTDKCNKNWQIGPDKNCCDCSQDQDLIVIDTDGDAADAMAMSMILNCTRNKSLFSIAGITCTWGSTSISNVFNNVVKTLQACGRFCEIPVYAGSNRGLVDDEEPLLSKYGRDAFGDFFYFPVVDEKKPAEHPAVFIANLVRESPGKVTVVCMGPLCNIAIAAHIYPDFYKDVKEILYLGGSMKGEVASENDKLDQYASMAVFNRRNNTNTDGPKITICIDECHNDTYFAWDWRDELSKKGTSVMNLLNFAEEKILNKDERDDQGWNCDTPFLAAALLDRSIFNETLGRCSVEPPGITRIYTEHPNPNVRVIKQVDLTKFKTLMYTCL